MALNNMKNNIGGFPLCWCQGCYLYQGSVGDGGSILQYLCNNPPSPTYTPLISLPGIPPPVPIMYFSRFFKTIGGGGRYYHNPLSSVPFPLSPPYAIFPSPFASLHLTCSILMYHPFNLLVNLIEKPRYQFHTFLSSQSFYHIGHQTLTSQHIQHLHDTIPWSIDIIVATYQCNLKELKWYGPCIEQSNLFSCLRIE